MAEGGRVELVARSTIVGATGKDEVVQTGETFEVDAAEAGRLVACGAAELPAPPQPAPDEGDGGPDAEAGDAKADPVDEDLLAAIETLDESDPNVWTGDGKPKVEPLSELLGREVTAAERDAAWAEFSEEEDEGSD